MDNVVSMIRATLYGLGPPPLAAAVALGSISLATEAWARGFSWGLMQVMGQVARESGFDALFLSTLCDPEQGLNVGCKVLRKKFDAARGDTTQALLAWNGGANPTYAAQVLARKPRY